MAELGIRRRTGVAATLILVAAALLSPSCAAAERIDLDGGWRFWFAGARPLDPAWLTRDPDGAAVVGVPYSWNVATGADHDGVGWYARTLVVTSVLVGRHAELHFDAVFYRARIWVNGVEAGTHEGGHTAFDVDVTRLLRAGENRVVVSADNRPGFATIPGYAMRLQGSGNVWYDWWRNGGITRDVSLTIADAGLIRRQSIRQTSGAARAIATTRLLVENVDSRAHVYRVTATIVGPDGKLAANAAASVTVQPGAAATPDLTLVVANPQLWNVGAAALYRVHAELRGEDGRLLDIRDDTIGFRTIAIRDRRLFVNGAPVRLTGMTRHEDSPWEGAAETRGTIAQDYRDLARLHVTLTRPVHYPQPQAVLDAADAAGMLLIPEIPIWQMTAAQLADPRLLVTAKRMMAEMIAESANHPSVLAWSIMNESDSGTPAGAAFVRAMKAHIRALDPDHLVTFADSDVSFRPTPRTAALADSDFIMANAYFGTWSGGEDAAGPWLDAIDRTYPDKMIVISEFGWPGPFSSDPAAADRARTLNLQGQLDAFGARAFVGGAIFWTYQDYRSNKNLYGGETDGYVDHGVVDEDRQRKPSWAAWEIRNRPLSVTARWTQDKTGITGFTADVRAAATGALPSYPLPGYRARWRAIGGDRSVIGAGETSLPDIATSVAIAGSWPGQTLPVALTIEILTPAGVKAGGADLRWESFKAGSEAYPPDPAELKPAR
jgi:beta-galactosidase/beta-glucuronidase